MGLFKTLLDAIRRIRGKQPVPPKPWKHFDLPPDDIEFFQELGLEPEDLGHPYAIPERGELPPAIPSATLEVILSGAWLGVASSNVNAWRFDEAAKTIDIQFLSGSVYRYGNCTTSDAIQFSASPSPGRFVWYVLRANATPSDPVWKNSTGRYIVTKLRGPNRHPQTGKIVFGPRKAWRFRNKTTGNIIRSPKRPWPHSR